VKSIATYAPTFLGYNNSDHSTFYAPLFSRDIHEIFVQKYENADA
jgi:hypothetical protein